MKSSAQRTAARMTSTVMPTLRHISGDVWHHQSPVLSRGAFAAAAGPLDGGG